MIVHLNKNRRRWKMILKCSVRGIINVDTAVDMSTLNQMLRNVPMLTMTLEHFPDTFIQLVGFRGSSAGCY